MGGDGAQLHLLLLRTNLESATQNCSLVPPNCSWELLECWGSLAAVSWEYQGRCHWELS